MTKKSLWFRAAALGFLLTVLLQGTAFAARCGALERGVLRLHILANSDSETDQSVKLAVRDAVLAASGEWYGETADLREAVAAVCTHLETVEAVADRTLRALGAQYSAKAEVCDAYFPTRVYENGALPAGKYRTLRVSLGEAKGHNWWCVLFPALCLPGASAELPEAAGDIATDPERYELRFFAAELFNRLRAFFDRGAARS